MKSPKVSVVIPTFNSRPDVVECLASVQSLDYLNYEIIVVDNSSADDTVKAIKQEFADVRLIENSSNLGVTGGRNTGARRAGGEYIFFLDHDTVVAENALSELVAVMERDQAIGAAGPVVYYYEDNGRIWAAGTSINLTTGKISFNNSNAHAGSRSHGLFDVQVLPTAFLVRKRVFDEVGGFDDAFFAVYEDTDFCFRVREAGHRIVCHTRAKIWHKLRSGDRGATEDVLNRGYFVGRNRILFMRRHASPVSFIIFISIFQPLFMLYYAYKSLQLRRPDLMLDFWRGSFAGLRKK
jgi:GT2 family glycosyltransferase